MANSLPTSDTIAEAAVVAIVEFGKLLDLGEEQSGAPAFADLAAVDTLAEPERSVRGRLLLLGLTGIQACWAAVSDSLNAMAADLQRRPHAVWSPMTLTRSVQEAVIFVRYLADPAIGTDQRLLRIANVWLEDMNNAVNASYDYSGVGGQNQRASALNGRAFAIGELRRGGFNVTTSTTDVPRSLELGDLSIGSIGYNTAEQAKQLMPPDAPETWRLASGAAHARPWYLTNNAVAKADGQWSAKADATAASVMIVAYALEKGVQTLGGFYGINTTSAEKRVNDVHKAFVQAMANAGVATAP